MYKGVVTFTDGSILEIHQDHEESLERFQELIKNECDQEPIESIEVYSEEVEQ